MGSCRGTSAWDARLAHGNFLIARPFDIELGVRKISGDHVRVQWRPSWVRCAPRVIPFEFRATHIQDELESYHRQREVEFLCSSVKKVELE